LSDKKVVADGDAAPRIPSLSLMLTRGGKLSLLPMEPRFLVAQINGQVTMLTELSQQGMNEGRERRGCTRGTEPCQEQMEGSGSSQTFLRPHTSCSTFNGKRNTRASPVNKPLNACARKRISLHTRKTRVGSASVSTLENNIQ
jgi:hypothetical protein